MKSTSPSTVPAVMPGARPNRRAAIRFGLWIALSLAVGAFGAATASAATTRIDGLPGSLRLFEPDLAVDPSNPRNVVVVSMDSVERGTALVDALNAFVSTDGGRTFDGRRVVLDSYLARPVDRAADPVVVFDRAGTAFFGQLVTAPGTPFESMLGVQRSVDAGASFEDPVAAVRAANTDPTRTILHDKEWLAVDRSGGPRDGDLYMAWNRIVFGSRGSVRARVAVARSTDGARSFSPPTLISSGRRCAEGPQIAAGPDGSIRAAWVSARCLKGGKAPKRAKLLAASSSDGGRTFSAPRRVSSFKAGRAAYSLVSLDTSDGGATLACWARGRAARKGSRGKRRPQGRAICARSRDGRRWKRPVAVAPKLGGIHDLVAVAAEGGRRFWVSLYAVKRRRTKVRLYRSDDGGRGFTPAGVLAKRGYPVGSEVTNTLLEGAKVADYTGLDAAVGRVLAAYVLPRGGRRSANSIYVTSLPTP